MAKERSQVLRGLGLEDASYILATIHREHNTDDAVRLKSIIEAYRYLLEHRA